MRRILTVTTALAGLLTLPGCANAVMMAANIAAPALLASAADSVKPGPVRVVFQDKNGAEIALAPLPPAKRVAVWPGNQDEESFADKISSRFTVTTPGVVKALFASAHLANTDLATVTNAELAEGFAVVCRKSNNDLVFADRSLGANDTALLAYSCRSGSIVWNQELRFQGITSENIAQAPELGVSEWARRVLDAESLGAQQANAH